jgi:hypothetical protein
MIKQRRSTIHLARYLTPSRRVRMALDAEPELGPVTLDSDDQQNLLATLEAHLPPAVHAQVCTFLDDCRDDAEAADDNNQDPAETEPLRENNGEAQDRRLSFDARWPEVARVRNLGGSEPQKRPVPASRRSGPSFDERFGPDASRIRTV